MIKLYETELSGNCHKVRMLLSFLGKKYESVKVNLREGEQKKPAFLKLNPLNTVPVIDDDGFVLRDSQAILVYLAEKYGKGKWMPKDAEGRGEVQQWLALCLNEVHYGLAVARGIKLMGRDGDYKQASETAHRALHAMQVRLKQRDWLAGSEPSVADVACYVYAALSHQGGIKLDNHPAVLAWLRRVEALPKFLAMPGLPYPDKVA
jgi:glutathione S-transferase